MSSNPTDDDDTEKRTAHEAPKQPGVRHNEELGVRTARFGKLPVGEALVELADLRAEEATISVTGEALDDEPGRVIVRIGGGVSVEAVLSPDEGREIADRIARAAEEADAEIGGGA